MGQGGHGHGHVLGVDLLGGVFVGGIVTVVVHVVVWAIMIGVVGVITDAILVRCHNLLDILFINDCIMLNRLDNLS